MPTADPFLFDGGWFGLQAEPSALKAGYDYFGSFTIQEAVRIYWMLYDVENISFAGEYAEGGREWSLTWSQASLIGASRGTMGTPTAGNPSLDVKNIVDGSSGTYVTVQPNRRSCFRQLSSSAPIPVFENISYNRVDGEFTASPGTFAGYSLARIIFGVSNHPIDSGKYTISCSITAASGYTTNGVSPARLFVGTPQSQVVGNAIPSGTAPESGTFGINVDGVTYTLGWIGGAISGVLGGTPLWVSGGATGLSIGDLNLPLYTL